MPSFTSSPIHTDPASARTQGRAWGSGALWTGAVLVGGTAGIAIALTAQAHHRLFALAIGGLLGIILGVLALAKFEWFVLALIALRSSMDALQTGSGLDPAAAVGLVFILATALWLLAQRQGGLLTRPSSLTVALLVVALAALVSALGSEVRSTSLQTSLKILAGVLMFVVLEQILRRDPDYARPLIGALLVSLIVPAAVAVSQIFTGSGFGQDIGHNRLRGTFVHPNPFATYLVMVLLVCAALLGTVGSRRREAIIALAALVSGVLLVLTYTRIGWITAVIGLTYILWRRRPRLLWMVPAALLAIAFLAPSTIGRFSDLSAASPVPGYSANSASWRVDYWKLILPMANSTPITGIGIGAVAVVRPEKLPPHNVFVQAYVEMGLFGLFAVVALVVAFYRVSHRRLKQVMGPPEERALAIASSAVGISLVLQFFSENLLTQTLMYWYAAAAMTIGMAARRRTLLLRLTS